MLPQEITNALSNNYANLIELSQTLDPRNEPFRSKYKSRDILEEMKTKLVEWMDNIREPDNIAKETVMLAAVYYWLATISISVEELSTSEEELNKCMALLKKNELETSEMGVLCAMNALNQLGILLGQRGESEQAIEVLKRSESLYFKYSEKSSEDPPCPYTFFAGEYHTLSLLEKLSFQKTHTLTLYYLAQVYRNTNELLKSAIYCHNTLRRQLEERHFDLIDWALNSATLSQFMVENFAFKEARHHLAAASHILDLRQRDLDLVQSEEERHLADVEQLNHRKSDVLRCWARYTLMLLKASRSRLMTSSDENDTCEEFSSTPSELLNLRFPTLETTSHENEVSSDFALTYEDARPIFLFGQKCLNAATNYYTLSDHASDYISIQQDLSQLYSALAFFEDDEQRQCKMYKRRIDLLERVVGSVSEVHYLQYCRSIWFELGEIYMNIILLKPIDTPHAIAKRNQQVKQALSYYDKYIKSFNDQKTGKLSEVLPEVYERLVLTSHICSARLLTKMVTLDKQQLLENTRASLKYYKFVTDYCLKREELKKEMKEEFLVCQEMVTLLPHKISKYVQQLS